MNQSKSTNSKEEKEKMSRIKLLLDVIENVRSLGDSLQILADAIASDEPKEEPKKKSKSKSESKPEPLAEDKCDVTLETVRAVCAEKSRAGFTAEVKAIITKYGADKLSAVKPEDYAAVLAEVEVLGNAE